MLDYRDPLFSVIVFLLLISLSIFITNFVLTLKERKRLSYLQKFIKKFEFLTDEEVNSLFSDNISIKALLLLAMGFEKEGSYEKSLNIYLAILENSPEIERFDILQKIGEVYLKIGFLHKARESMLEILRTYPENIKALKLLLVIDDKLKNFEEIGEIIEILEEIGESVEKEKGYFLFQQAMFNQEKEELGRLKTVYPFLKRGYYNYFLLTNSEKVFKEVTESEVYQMLDLFWNLKELPNTNEGFIQIKSAKKEIQTDKKAPIFELEVLKYTPKELADLEFEYVCKNCKHLFPLYEDRCPNCKELFSFEVEVNIIQK